MPSKKVKKPAGASFCVMPWFNLATETNGKCKICCVVMADRYVKKDDGSDFHIQQDDIGDIWNSKYLKDVRKKMLAGEEVSDCFYCNGKAKSGIESPRDQYNDRWLDKKTLELVHESEARDGEVSILPQSLEPRPGIKCNLSCNMCWSLSSSKILAERKKWLKDSENLPDFLRTMWSNEVRMAMASDFKWAESEIYNKNLEACLPHLKRLYFTGGEPVLIRSNIRAMEKLLEHGKTDTLVAFTTNLTRLEEKFFNLLEAFPNIEITASIDGVGGANDYVRYPSEWKTVSSNLLKLNSYSHIDLSILAVVQMCNILSILDLFDWVLENQTFRQIPIILTVLQHPEYLKLSNLDERTRQVALERIDHLFAEKRLLSSTEDHLQALRSHLLEEDPRAMELRRKGWEFHDFMDRSRGTTFLSAFPEFKEVREKDVLSDF